MTPSGESVVVWNYPANRFEAPHPGNLVRIKREREREGALAVTLPDGRRTYLLPRGSVTHPTGWEVASQ
jgi:hypothetical protein